MCSKLDDVSASLTEYRQLIYSIIYTTEWDVFLHPLNWDLMKSIWGARQMLWNTRQGPVTISKIRPKYSFNWNPIKLRLPLAAILFNESFRISGNFQNASSTLTKVKYILIYFSSRWVSTNVLYCSGLLVCLLPNNLLHCTSDHSNDVIIEIISDDLKMLIEINIYKVFIIIS